MLWKFDLNGHIKSVKKRANIQSFRNFSSIQKKNIWRMIKKPVAFDKTYSIIYIYMGNGRLKLIFSKNDVILFRSILLVKIKATDNGLL